MEKYMLFFAIYEDSSRKFTHSIIYRQSKQLLEEELREQGFTPKAIFSPLDIDKIRNREFDTSKDTDNVVDYFLIHLEEWDMAM